MKTCSLFETLNEDAKRVFNVIQKNGPLTKNDICFITGLKLTTLIRIMQPLEDLRLIVESKIGESSGGRKPVLYDVNANDYCLIGVDISRTYTQIAVTNLKMEILFKQRFKMQQSCSPQVTVEFVENAVKCFFEKNNAGLLLLGAGIGTVGPLNREKGIVMNPANFAAPGWFNVPLQSMFEARFGCPVILDNGANAAVLAETYYGAGKGLKNTAYFHCGVGIRTGMISSGMIIRTLNDSEDVFGHMVVDVDGEKCNCGNRGCIESYSSIHAITKKFISEAKKGRPTCIAKPADEINYIDICNAAENNDLLAKEVLECAAAVMGTGLANFIHLLNPGLVILSGPLVDHSETYYNVCTDIAAQKSFPGKENAIEFNRGGRFGKNAISVGSAAMVIESFILNGAQN